MKKCIKFFAKKIPYIRNLYYKINREGEFPAGHYYSPIPSRDDVLEYVKSRKALNLELPDVNLRREKQFELLNEYVRFYIKGSGLDF